MGKGKTAAAAAAGNNVLKVDEESQVLVSNEQ